MYKDVRDVIRDSLSDTMTPRSSSSMVIREKIAKKKVQKNEDENVLISAATNKINKKLGKLMRNKVHPGLISRPQVVEKDELDSK